MRIGVKNTTVKNTKGVGMDVSSQTNAETFRTFSKNTFTDNSSYPVSVPSYLAGALDKNSNYDNNGSDHVFVQGTGGRIQGLELTWSNLNVPYLVGGSVKFQEFDAPKTNLTIRPGTKVEFQQNTGLRFRKGATLTAEGTEQEPIVLTGAKEQRGLWTGIRIVNSSSVANKLHHVRVAYAGQGEEKPASLDLGNETKISLKNSSFVKSGGYGMWVNSKQLSFTNFTNNTFENNAQAALQIPFRIADQIDTASTYKPNDTNAVELRGGKGLDLDMTLKDIGVPYHVYGRTRFRDTGNAGHLSVEPGVTVAFDTSHGLEIAGDDTVLQANGTASDEITFTGIRKTAGSWRGIQFRGTKSALNSLKHVNIEYAGTPPFKQQTGAALTIHAGSFGGLTRVGTLQNVEVQSSLTNSIFLSYAGDRSEIEILNCSNVTVSGDVAGERTPSNWDGCVNP